MIARRILGGVSAVVALFAGVHAARAQVHQTDMAQTPLPAPVGTAELNLVTQSWAFNAQTQSYKDPSSGATLVTPIVYGQYYSPPAFPQFVDGDAITLQ